MRKRVFTSESVTEGHPDKICDRIADAVLDELIRQDPMSRSAVEVCCTTGLVFLFGEISSRAYVDMPKLVRQTVKNIGYDNADYGFDGDACSVMTAFNKQSSDIAAGVDRSAESHAGAEDGLDVTGAGDQGIMFGYAVNETEEYMPCPIVLANRLAKGLADIRKNGIVPYLRPDGKTQVTVEYDDAGMPARIDAVVIAAQHDPDVTGDVIEHDLSECLLDTVIPHDMIDKNTKIFINRTGRFVTGGPVGDSGLTGRKIIVDTYGGRAHHGGGAFSGKDCTKVDRTASYMARYVAKNIVAAGLADECEVQLSYAIGVANPVSVNVNTFGTGKTDEDRLEKIITDNFELRPEGMIRQFGLRRPIYEQVSVYGHFGRPELDLPWEKTDMADVLRKYLP